MELRDFGLRSGLLVPPVNLGSMRLPQDTQDAVSLIRYAIDMGMRYIDTSRGYGEAEWIIGRALKDGYRDKVILSTKCSPWVFKPRSDDVPNASTVRRRIEESMIRLDVDYLDYYQVWNINSREHYDQAVAPGGMVDGILKAINDGLVRHTGFTNHDSVDNLEDYLEEADWCDIILLTYNLLNRQYEPSIKTAWEKGIGTLIMNPVGGGRLTEDSPILRELAEEVEADDVPELAIRYIISNPRVTTIISGINQPSDVEHTIKAANKPSFNSGQLKKINDFLDARTPANNGFCTGCGYCLPCPQDIDIPAIMRCIDNARNWGFSQTARIQYGKIKSANANACTQCRACESKCTQHLAIANELKWADNNLI